MRIAFIALALSFSFSVYAKEWKTLKQYQKATQKVQLSPSDWLTSDRKKNTSIWQDANAYNLLHDRPQDYQNITQRRDFYIWINHEFESQGREVLWQKMAYYISFKLRLLKSFPHCMFTLKNVKLYSQQASELIFNSAFVQLKALYTSEKVLTNEEAINWDKMMLHDEQYIWVESLYKDIDHKSLKQIERIVKGKFFYALVVPKAIRFEGDISNPAERYHYALNIFRPYCADHLK
jgi:hypothetical protein